MEKRKIKKRASLNTFLSNRSKDYMQYGRYMVQDMSVEDMPLRLISFLGDMVAMLFPILILDLVFLMVTGGLLSYNMFRFSSILVDFLIMASIVISNAIFIVLFKGQTFGKLALNYKVVYDADNKEVKDKVLLIREIVGITIPLLILYIFLQLLGFLVFMLINGLFVIIDRKHRSIIDMIMKTKVVILSDKGKKTEVVVEKEKVQEPLTPAENKYDLHVYSSFSHDGEMEVEDLLKRAQASGVKVLSICDHNSVKANNLAEKLAPMYDVEYISGINIDCDYEGHHVRILGYNINSNDPRFTQIEYENLAKEKAVSARRIDLFEDFTGFKVNAEKLNHFNRFQIITEDAIARDILSNPVYRKEKLLQPYLNGNKKDTPIASFKKDFFAPGAPAYVPIVHPQATDMIALIKACGGLPVLAHPMYSLSQYKDVLNDLIQEGLIGLEIFTPHHTMSDMKYLIPLVKQNHLLVSAGSEYHGSKRSSFTLGKTGCPKDVEDIVLNFINTVKKKK